MTARDATTGIAAAAVASVAGYEVLSPFAGAVHTWWFALGVTVAGAYLLWVGIADIVVGRTRAPLALAALGSALLAACVAYAAFLVGQPERLPAAPGQTYRPPHAADLAIEFPAVLTNRTRPATASSWPDRITIDEGANRSEARPGDVVRAGAFVFAIESGPIAFVDVRSRDDKPVTMTQPDGPAFLSPFLTFAGLDNAQPEDYFAVPALHRTVQVDYWAGLPSRGINVPFLVLRIAEENGGTLFEGVAVSGKTLRKAAIALTFSIGTYPVVTASSAPPLVPFWAGIAMVAAGLLLAGIRWMRRIG